MAAGALRDLRNRLLSSARFRDTAQKIPFVQAIARYQANDLFRLVGGFIHSQVLLAAVRLDLFERLRDGPVDATALREETGLSAEGAEHLFAAADALDLIDLSADGRVALGPRGATLVDNPGVIAMIRHHALFYEDLVDPVALFRDEQAQTRMSALWAYASGDKGSPLDTAAVRQYSELMAVSQTMVADQVLGSVPLRRYTSLLDIGGGSGAFAMAAARRWPRLDVAVADLPPVAALARERIRNAGLEDRIDVFAADATADRLPDGYDMVSLIRILHDHGDDTVAELLRTAYRALRPGGTLLVGEPMAGRSPSGRLVSAYFNVYLYAMGSGVPRPPERLAALLAAAGFRRVRRRRTRVPMIAGVLLADRQA